MRLIQRWDVGAILVEAALLFLFVLTLLTGGGQPGRAGRGPVSRWQLYGVVLVSGGHRRLGGSVDAGSDRNREDIDAPRCWRR